MNEDTTIVVTERGRSRTIVLDAEFPICTIDGERKSIDDLGPTSGGSLQDAVSDLIDAAFPEPG